MHSLIINAGGLPVYPEPGLPEVDTVESLNGEASSATGDHGIIILQEKQISQSKGRFHFFRLRKNISIRHLFAASVLRTIISLDEDICYSVEGFGQLRLRKGEFLFLPQCAGRVEAELKKDKEYRLFEASYSLEDIHDIVKVSPTLRQLLPNSNPAENWLPVPHVAGIRAMDAITEILHNPYHDQSLNDFYFDDNLRRLLFLLASQGNPGTPTHNNDTALAYKVRNWIQDNIASEADPQALAAKYEVSPRRLHRVFKKVFRQCPSEFAREHRMQLAWDWMTRTGKSVKEVSYSLGFRTQQNFSTKFKKWYGVTPMEARFGKQRK